MHTRADADSPTHEYMDVAASRCEQQYRHLRCGWKSSTLTSEEPCAPKSFSSVVQSVPLL